jgi:hypothetical protein
MSVGLVLETPVQEGVRGGDDVAGHGATEAQPGAVAGGPRCSRPPPCCSRPPPCPTLCVWGPQEMQCHAPPLGEQIKHTRTAHDGDGSGTLKGRTKRHFLRSTDGGAGGQRQRVQPREKGRTRLSGQNGIFLNYGTAGASRAVMHAARRGFPIAPPAGTWTSRLSVVTTTAAQT